MNSAEPAWVAAEQPALPEPSPPNGERVSNLAATIKEEDGKGMILLRLHSCVYCQYSELLALCDFHSTLFTSGI